MALQRLVITFDGDDLVVRCLYKTQGSPGPGTKARRREARDLARGGLEQALKALTVGDLVDLGTSGYEVREDVFGLPAASLPTQTIWTSPQTVRGENE